MSQSDLEATMALHIRANELPEPEREYRFAPPRRWRFDFAWPAAMLALEVEGGVWSTGCLLYTSPSPRDRTRSRMPSSA